MEKRPKQYLEAITISRPHMKSLMMVASDLLYEETLMPENSIVPGIMKITRELQSVQYSESIRDGYTGIFTFLVTIVQSHTYEQP